MIERTIAYYLGQDNISTNNPAAFVTAYPQYFSSNSQVPVHFYTSLSKIWTGSDLPSSVWSPYITPYIGIGTTRASGIGVYTVELKEQYFAADPTFESNIYGAENARILIHLKIPEQIPLNNQNTIRDAILRIQRILDTLYKNGIVKQGDLFSNASIDNVIDPTVPIKCHYIGISEVVNQKEIFLEFSVSFNKLFLK